MVWLWVLWLVCRIIRGTVVEAVWLGFVVEHAVVTVVAFILLCKLFVIALVGAERQRYCSTCEGRVEIRPWCISVVGVMHVLVVGVVLVRLP